MNGVIFDLDGTLLNTVPDLTTAANAMLAHYGERPITQRQVMDYLGHGLGELVRQALPKGSVISPQEALVVFNEAYARVYRQRTQPYPGMVELVAALDQHGIPMAVVSNKAQSFLEGLVAMHFPQGIFKAVIGERPDVARKPDPMGLLHAAKAMGTTPFTTVLVGDTEVDAQAAANAGMRMIGVDWGFRPVAALREAGVKTLVSSPQEMLELVKGYAIIK